MAKRYIGKDFMKISNEFLNFFVKNKIK
jgi:hypothetical protein